MDTPSPEVDGQIGVLRFKAPSQDAFGAEVYVTQAGRYTLYGDVVTEPQAPSLEDQENSDQVIVAESSDENAEKKYKFIMDRA